MRRVRISSCGRLLESTRRVSPSRLVGFVWNRRVVDFVWNWGGSDPPRLVGFIWNWQGAPCASFWVDEGSPTSSCFWNWRWGTAPQLWFGSTRRIRRWPPCFFWTWWRGSTPCLPSSGIQGFLIVAALSSLVCPSLSFCLDTVRRVLSYLVSIRSCGNFSFAYVQEWIVELTSIKPSRSRRHMFAKWCHIAWTWTVTNSVPSIIPECTLGYSRPVRTCQPTLRALGK